jgi:hypothetical protein
MLAEHRIEQKANGGRSANSHQRYGINDDAPSWEFHGRSPAEKA